MNKNKKVSQHNPSQAGFLFERTAMPEKFKQALNISIGIPVWSLASFLAVAIFYAGSALNKLNTLLENSDKSDQRVMVMRDKQNERGVLIANQQTQIQNHENRITALERNAIESRK